MAKPIMNLDEVEFDDVEENGRYTSSRGQIGRHIGARDLGYNLTVLPPGKVQCPFHCHHGEEEMFLILEGEGELRFGDQRYPIRQHDVHRTSDCLAAGSCCCLRGAPRAAGAQDCVEDDCRVIRQRDGTRCRGRPRAPATPRRRCSPRFATR